MKKTFSTLLALSSISMAATEIDLSEESNFYDVSGISFGNTYVYTNSKGTEYETKNNVSIALTLDMEAVSETAGDHVALLTLQGVSSRNAALTNALGLGINSNDVSGWSGNVSDSNPIGGKNSPNISVSLNNPKAQYVTLVFTSYSVPSINKDMWAATVMFWNSEGSLVGTPVTDNMSQGLYISSFSKLYLNKELITSAVIYDTVLSEGEAIEEAKKLIAISPAAPEPTTATLSLLALAGLAARRRRA